MYDVFSRELLEKFFISTDVSFAQSSNMLRMLFTFEVSKLDRSSEEIELQEVNIQPILCTSEVLKSETSSAVSEEQPQNMFSML